MFFTLLIIINQCYNAKYIDFKDESVSTSVNGQPHYKGTKCLLPNVHYREVPLYNIEAPQNMILEGDV